MACDDIGQDRKDILCDDDLFHAKVGKLPTRVVSLHGGVDPVKMRQIGNG